MTVKSARLLAALSLFLVPFSQPGAKAAPPSQKLQQQLIHAVLQNQIEAVQTLLGQGGDPNARVTLAKEDAWAVKNVSSTDAAPPLIVLACRFGCLKSQAIQLLVDKGADVNIMDTNGMTPLMAASELDWDPSIALLLKHGANVKAKDRNGKTALMYAMGNRGLNAAALLLAKGADINARDKEGKTPLMYAIIMAARDPIMLIFEDEIKKEKEARERYLQLVQFLIEQKADVNTKDAVGNTPLKLATALGQPEIVQILRQAGAKK